MRNHHTFTPVALAVGLACLGASPVMADGGHGKRDFGAMVEDLLHAQSERLFGVKKPLQNSADESDYVARELASADQRILLAKGLKAEFVTRSLGTSGDFIAFWPSADNYSHLIVCIEQGLAAEGRNAGVQRVDVATGAVETIVYGMDRCDGIRTTDWGTVLATEETTDGRAYEIIDPLNTTGHWIADRSSGDVRDAIDSLTPSQNIVQRQDLPTMAWEGLIVLPSGVVIGGDELRPGSYENDFGTRDTDGGAIFKFVPAVPRMDDGKISHLDDSPLAAGFTYAMQVSCNNGNQQFGQGCEIGNAAWVGVNALDARMDANRNGATGYYRPEDLEQDPLYHDAENPAAIRFCVANTGRESAYHFGEVLCGVDSDPLLADSDIRSVVVNRLVEGDTEFNSFDNLGFQPKTGNLSVIEDHQYGDVFSCLRDGDDRDIKTDGCVRIASVVDPAAEPTGFIFDASGETAYVVVQHGEQPAELLDFDSNPVNGRTDDLIKITGFKLKHNR
ncbi:MAG: hypothetical protein J5I92_02315 [Thiogranum sp.]|nr:hypothetical protein [Thiogranum sp.]